MPAFHHAHLDLLELDQDVKDANHHVLNAQPQPASVLTVWIPSSLDQTLENASKALHATMVKLKLLESAQEFVMLAFTSTTEPVSSVDAQADSRTMDSEDVLVHQFQLEDANHQLSD